MTRRSSGDSNVHFLRPRVIYTPKRPKMRDPAEVAAEKDRVFKKWLMFAAAALLTFISVGRAIELSFTQMFVLVIFALIGAVMTSHIQKRG